MTSPSPHTSGDCPRWSTMPGENMAWAGDLRMRC
jgi:hypothetical protein